MSKFTERLRNRVVDCYDGKNDLLRQSADMIDELENALREARVYVPEHHGPVVHKIESVLTKLGRM